MARQFICTEDTPVVQTKAGKVRGFILDGIYHYYGIKYANAKRFMMPEPVKPWKGLSTPIATDMSVRCLSRNPPWVT